MDGSFARSKCFVLLVVSVCLFVCCCFSFVVVVVLLCFLFCFVSCFLLLFFFSFSFLVLLLWFSFYLLFKMSAGHLFVVTDYALHIHLPAPTSGMSIHSVQPIFRKGKVVF